MLEFMCAAHQPSTLTRRLFPSPNALLDPFRSLFFLVLIHRHLHMNIHPFRMDVVRRRMVLYVWDLILYKHFFFLLFCYPDPHFSLLSVWFVALNHQPKESVKLWIMKYYIYFLYSLSLNRNWLCVWWMKKKREKLYAFHISAHIFHTICPD